MRTLTNIDQFEVGVVPPPPKAADDVGMVTFQAVYFESDLSATAGDIAATVIAGSLEPPPAMAQLEGDLEDVRASISG